MKNKKIIWIIPLVLFVLAILMYTVVPGVYKLAFVARHILVYMLVAYLIVLVAAYEYLKFSERFKDSKEKLYIFRGINIVATIFVLILASNFQMMLIDIYEVPELNGCIHFDQFDNIIYTSQLKYQCPDLEDVVMTSNGEESTLSFSVIEHDEGYHYNLFLESREPVTRFYRDITVETNITYTYITKRISSVLIESTTYDINGQEVKVHSYKKIITNTWVNEEFESIQETYYVGQDFDLDDYVKEDVVISVDDDTPSVRVISTELADSVFSDKLVMLKDTTYGSELNNDIYAEIEIDYHTDTYGSFTRSSVYPIGNFERTNEEILYWDMGLKHKIRYYAHAFGKPSIIGEFSYTANIGDVDNYQPSLSSYDRIINGSSFVNNDDRYVDYYDGSNGISYSQDDIYSKEKSDEEYGSKAKYYLVSRDTYGEYYKKSNTYIEFVDSPFILGMGYYQDYIYMIDNYSYKEHIEPYQYNPVIDGYSIG